MKIQCELCKEIVPIGAFRSTVAGIDVTCDACGGAFFVAAPDAGSAADREASAGAADDEVGMRCPKCGQGQAVAEACRICGLHAVLFDDFQWNDAEQVEDLEPLWATCLAKWDDVELHREFLEAVSSTLQYAWAAGLYRARLRDQPGDEVCQDQLTRIGRMAEATMASGGLGDKRRVSKSAPYKNVALLLILLLLVAGLGGLYLLFKLKATSDEPKAPPSLKLRKRQVHPPPPTPSLE